MMIITPNPNPAQYSAQFNQSTYLLHSLTRPFRPPPLPALLARLATPVPIPANVLALLRGGAFALPGRLFAALLPLLISSTSMPASRSFSSLYGLARISWPRRRTSSPRCGLSAGDAVRIRILPPLYLLPPRPPPPPLYPSSSLLPCPPKLPWYPPSWLRPTPPLNVGGPPPSWSRRRGSSRVVLRRGGSSLCVVRRAARSRRPGPPSRKMRSLSDSGSEELEW